MALRGAGTTKDPCACTVMATAASSRRRQETFRRQETDILALALRSAPACQLVPALELAKGAFPS